MTPHATRPTSAITIAHATSDAQAAGAPGPPDAPRRERLREARTSSREGARHRASRIPPRSRGRRRGTYRRAPPLRWPALRAGHAALSSVAFMTVAASAGEAARGYQLVAELGENLLVVVAALAEPDMSAMGSEGPMRGGAARPRHPHRGHQRRARRWARAGHRVGGAPDARHRPQIPLNVALSETILPNASMKGRSDIVRVLGVFVFRMRSSPQSSPAAPS